MRENPPIKGEKENDTNPFNNPTPTESGSELSNAQATAWFLGGALAGAAGILAFSYAVTERWKRKKAKAEAKKAELTQPLPYIESVN